MSKTSGPDLPNDFQPQDACSNNPQKPSHLKLVISNSSFEADKEPVRKPAPSSTEFCAEVYEKRPYVYELAIYEPSLDLSCDIPLKIGKWKRGIAAACHFPDILTHMNEYLDADELFYSMLMIHFQLDVLEQLFLFCSTHKASKLFIYMDDEHAKGFRIYRDFLEHQDETLTADGEKTEMLILVNEEALARFETFKQNFTVHFEKDLWREQRRNPLIRRYLKSYIKKRTFAQGSIPIKERGQLCES